MDTGLVLDIVVKSTVVLVGAMGVARCMRRASAAARHAVWTGAMAAVWVMPVLAILVPAWRVLPRWAGAAEKRVGRPVAVMLGPCLGKEQWCGDEGQASWEEGWFAEGCIGEGGEI